MKFFLLELFRFGFTFSHRPLALLGGVLLCLVHTMASAQNVSFAGQISTVPVSGLIEPWGVAVDERGNLFLTDSQNHRVVEVPSDGGAQTSIPVSTSLPMAQLAVDTEANIFVGLVSSLNGEVIEIPVGGTQTAISTGLMNPTGVAVDSVGDVLIAEDYASPGAALVEVPEGGGSQSVIYQPGSTRPYASPFHVALDPTGDIFVSPAFLSPSGFGVMELPSGGGPPMFLGSLMGVTSGVAVDAAGNLFMGDISDGLIVKLPAGGGSQVTIASGLPDPQELAVDNAGNLFFSLQGNDPGAIERIQYLTVDFGTVNVCASGASNPAPCSETKTLTYNVTASGTLGTPVVLTVGSQNFDFTLGSGSTCTGAVTAGTTCTVNVVFTPRFTGARAGAVEVTDASGNVLATTYVHGYRAGPELAFNDPATQKLRAGGLNSPHGLAVDGAGDAFVADTDNVRVVKIPAGGGTPVAIGSGFITPAATAVDLAGNVYVADPGLTSIVEIPANGGAQTTVGSGLSGPNGVAVDRLGNIYVVVYVANSQTNSVIEIPGGTGSPITIASGLSEVGGLAVDGTGDVFVSEVVANAVLEYPYGGGTPTTLANDFSSPAGVATDGNGNVYVADTGNDRIVEIGPGGVQSIWGTGLNTPIGVAVDGGGSIFISDTLNDRVVDVERNVAPGLTFASTTVGATSSDSPRSVQVLNIGNATLTGTGLTVGANFVQVPGSGTPADCAANFSLAPGASCNLSISFQPTVAGSLTANAVLTDNSLNGRSPSQSVSLTGTGKAITTTTTATSSPNPSVSGKTVMLTATVKAASGAVPAGTIKFINGTTVFATATLNGGVATYNTSKLPAGSLALTAAYEGSSTDATSVSPVLTQVVLVPTVTTVTSSPNPSVSGKTVTLTATVTAASGPTPTGSVLFKNGTTTIGTGTLVNGVATRRTDALPSGTLSITAVYPVTGPDAGSTSGILTQVVNP